MSSGRLPPVVFVAAGAALIVFRRAAARMQIARNRAYYASPVGRWLTVALSYIVPGGWMVVGALVFLKRLPLSGAADERVVLGIGREQWVGLAIFIVGALLIVFHGAVMRQMERRIAWDSTPRGEAATARIFAYIGGLLILLGALGVAGILD